MSGFKPVRHCRFLQTALENKGFRFRQVTGMLSLLIGLLSGPASIPAVQAQNLHAMASATTTVESGLTAYDASPLRNRTPLILIHGIGGQDNHLFDWHHFLAFARQNPNFQKQYKIYLYHYDSGRSVPEISDNLQQLLTTFIRSWDGRNVKILAYSEGGLLTRNALQDPYLDAHTAEVLTIATPFHGSPLANPAWLQSQVKTESPLSLVRMWQKPAYAITRRKYPAFKEDFHWDNFDGSLPSASLLNGVAMPQEPPVDYALAHKKNFITYGSYFGTEVDPDILPKALGLKTPLPREHIMLSNMFRKNILFSLIRHNIGRLPLAPVTSSSPESTTLISQTASIAVADENRRERESRLYAETPDKTVLPVSMMMFNDGISPISSSLWLGRYLPERRTAAMGALPVGRLWDALRSLKGHANARLFAGLDHRNWMDGNTRTGQGALQDLLNPDEAPRSVFEWILYDLMS